MTVSEKINALKKEMGFTTKELSERSGIAIGTLNKILSSSTKSVKSENLAALSNVLGVPIDYFLSDELFQDNDKVKEFGFIRVAAVTPDGKLGNVEETFRAITKCVEDLSKRKVALAVFPELTLSSYTLSDLFYQETVLKNCEKYLLKLRDFSRNYEMLFFVGCPLKKDGKIYNTAVAICKGDILGVVPKTYIPNYNEFYERRYFACAERENSDITIGNSIYPFGTKLIFENMSMSGFTVAAEICEDLWVANSPSIYHTQSGANIIVNLSAGNETVGKAKYRKSLVEMQSAKCVCAYVYSNAGSYESTTDLIFSAHNIISENGNVLSESEPFGKGLAIADIDIGFIEYERSKLSNWGSRVGGYERIYFDFKRSCDGSLRDYSKTPFIPDIKSELEDRVNMILRIQSGGLVRRIEQINCKTVVIGVSGGLDSTLALLVAARAMDMLKRKRKDIIAVTMPCFGTTDRTKSNAVLLADALGVTLKEVNISKSVRQHFEDIGHSEEVKDVTYENAQARERTQVLMDIANDNGGIVIGTGDLSELALGWATYNGDHMSMYGVNASVPKTLIRYIVEYIAENSQTKVKTVLNDILLTPVSPELLPSDENGEIAQKTEDLVGPYILHDFFLYHFIRNGFSPSKIYAIAVKTFIGDFASDTIYHWLEVFIKRFFTQQFKRSCMPDGVKVGSVSLSPRGDWRMPSDSSYADFIKDLESVKAN